MRDSRGQIEEERGPCRPVDKIQRLLHYHVMGIDLVIEVDFLSVFPQIVGIITVRSALSEITEEIIESLPVRLALVSRTAESPFADTGGNIASGLEDFRYSDLFAGKRPVVRVPVVCRLALIASDEAVPGVFPCHKDAS